MTDREKELIAKALADEKAVADALKRQYSAALKDINAAIKELDREILRLGGAGDEAARSKVYQKQYQEALKAQVGEITGKLNAMNDKQMHAYLTNAYENGFVGTLYSLQGQGLPLLLPIDEAAMLRAVTTSGAGSKVKALIGESTAKLKSAITDTVSRGLASGLSYTQIAQQLRGVFGSDFNRMFRIARTEGGRVDSSARYAAQRGAKDLGADIIKEWDATLDKRTRPEHAALNGQLRELEDPFEVGMYKAEHPHAFGVASQDINCRCTVTSRARWALSPEELERIGQPIDAETYEKFKIVYDKKAKGDGDFLIPSVSQDRAMWRAKEWSEADKRAHEQLLGKLDPTLRDALRNYTGEDYSLINDHLRGLMTLSKHDKDRVLDTIRAMDQAFANASGLKHAVQVYRGTNLFPGWGLEDTNRVAAAMRNGSVTEKAEAQAAISKLNGQRFTDAGYLSTSTDKSSFAGGTVQWDLVAHKGASGIDVRSISEHSEEREMLFNAGSGIVIDKAFWDDVKGRLRIIGRIVTP